MVMSDSPSGSFTRREFVERAGALGLAVALPGAAVSRAQAAPAVPATIAVSGAQWGVSTAFIGATEGNVRFDVADLEDAGVSTYRIYGGMSRWEWQDDDGVYGEPTIDQIKADPNVVNWNWWDDAMTNPPNGSDYWWSGDSGIWQGNARTIFSSLAAHGIRPVLTIRNRDNNGNPGWSPNPPVTNADWNEWWEHVFATVYWLNVRNDYRVDDFEVHNEPNNRGQGWGGTEAQYFELVQYTHDAIDWVYRNFLPGRAYHVYAPVTSGGSSWPLDALQQVAGFFDSVDIHDYSSDITDYFHLLRLERLQRRLPELPGPGRRRRDEAVELLRLPPCAAGSPGRPSHSPGVDEHREPARDRDRGRRRALVPARREQRRPHDLRARRRSLSVADERDRHHVALRRDAPRRRRRQSDAGERPHDVPDPGHGRRAAPVLD
jgi:hypothetical protein